MPQPSNITQIKSAPVSNTEAAVKQWEERRNRSKALYTGFKRVDSIWMPASGQFNLLAGRPGAFKTTLAWQIGCNLSAVGKKVLWVNLEPSMAQMAEQYVARSARIPRWVLGAHGQPLNLSQIEALNLAMVKFKKLPIVFHSSNNDVTSVVERTKRVGFDVVVVDYLQLMTYPGARTPPERIEAVSHALRDLAHNHNVFVLALVQMNRAIERDGEESRIPKLSDLAGSAALEADADIVSFMFDIKRRGDHCAVTMYVGKNRYGPADQFISMNGNGAMCEVSEITDMIGTPRTPAPKPVDDDDDD